MACFFMVGAANTVFGFGLILLFMYGLRQSPHVSNAAAYALTFLTSYLAQRRLTFKSAADTMPEFLRFSLVYAFSYATNFLALTLLINWTQPLLAQAGAATAFVASSYVGQRLYVFRKRAEV